jgi:hypothetical protein
MVVLDPMDRRNGTVDGRWACRLAGEREVRRGRKHQLRQDGQCCGRKATAIGWIPAEK